MAMPGFLPIPTTRRMFRQMIRRMILSYRFFPQPKGEARGVSAAYRYSGSLLAILLAFGGFLAHAGENKGLLRGETVAVAAVVDGDTVVMKKPIGRASEIRLVGIQAPKLPLDRPNFVKWPLADDAKAALEDLVRGESVTLSYGGRRMDRHGRLLAHLHLGDGTWVQGRLLAGGMARVYSFPDNRALVAEMLTEERTARQEYKGIWRNAFYRIRTPEDAGGDIGTFQLVEGRVFDVAVVRGRAYLNFGPNWRTDFTISIAPNRLRQFNRDGVDVTTWKSRLVRVRGWLDSYNGPMIDVTHPEQIELIE